MSKQNSNSEKQSLVITLLLQLAVFAFLYFMVAWEAPDPPLPVYGVELTMSTSENASQISQNTEEISEISEAERDDNIESLEEEITEETSLDEQQVTEPFENEATSQDITEEAIEAEEEVASEANASDEAVEKETESNDQLETNQTEEAATTSSEVKQSNDKNQTAEKEDTTSQIQEVAIDDRALFPSSGQGTATENESISVNVLGFKLANAPEINDTTDESGKITFEISVGDDGYALPGKVVYSSVSPTAVAVYRQAIQQLYFEQTSANVPPMTKGTITFIIKSK